MDSTLRYNVYASKNFPVDISDIRNIVAYKLKKLHFHMDRIMPSDNGPFYVVTAINRFGVESSATEFNHPKTAHQKQPRYEGNIAIHNDTLHILSPVKSPFLMITDGEGRIVKTMKYEREIPLSSLHRGVYTLRSLYEKGKSQSIGKFQWGF